MEHAKCRGPHLNVNSSAANRAELAIDVDRLAARDGQRQRVDLPIRHAGFVDVGSVTGVGEDPCPGKKRHRGQGDEIEPAVVHHESRRQTPPLSLTACRTTRELDEDRGR